MPTVYVHTNTSHGSAVTIADLGIIIPASGGSENFDEERWLSRLIDSEDLHAYLTDDAYTGSSTLELSPDGTNKVDDADVIEWLRARVTTGSGADHVTFCPATDLGTISGGTLTVDWAKCQMARCVISANVTTVTFTNPPPGDCTLTLLIAQNGTGGYTVGGWPSSVKWPGGTAPTISAGADDEDVISLKYLGSTLGYYAGYLQDFS